ncbi:MAG: NAD-dependent succinate-semialdehyde dehydrogenase [Deltaproteobacteria bacterium RIFCSPLOWO2_02_56_12]|nr:MAG: NAD-dependent succinate-semialdehyde dehydrogenase [Deltaproteobacteria bacterium RIFCSPLOWO2_02_56_12]
MAKFFVAGEYQDSEGKQATEVRNPATGEVVDTVPKGTANDARRAIEVASGALKKWSEMAPAKRGAILLEAGRLVTQQEKELTNLLTREQGKPIRESILEIRRFVHTLDHYGGMAKSLRTGAVLLDNGRHGLILRKPLGVCGAIVPWNFPVSLMGNKLGPALLAGNTVVVKPAATTPLTALRCVELIDKAIQAGGGPKGVINVVTGPGSVVGEELLVNSTVRKIGFTGATDTGRRVMQSAAKDFKHVTLELGGSDPMIVCDDADLDRAVSAASVGRFFNCGQACLAVKRLYLFDKIADVFMEKLVEKVKKLRIGDGLKPDTLMGPLHTAGQRQEVEEQIEEAVKRGARVLYGAQRPKGGDYDKGFYLQPTLLADVDPASRILQEECFGPALPIVRVKDLDHAIEQANNSIFGLGSSVWTRDINRAMAAAERIESGYTWINSAQIIYDELPFGGVKQSGLGKEHGNEAIDHYTETKSVVIATETQSEAGGGE